MYGIELNNVRRDANFNTKINKNSKAVEIFSAIIKGEDTTKYGKNVDTVMKHIADLSSKADAGDGLAKAEINSYVRIALESPLQTRIDLFDFMGKFTKVGYADQVMLTKYKHTTRSGFQASQGDVPLSTVQWEESPMATQTISGGFAINYRELLSGNLNKVSEGIEQVKTDMHNKAMNYVLTTLYNEVKNHTGVKYFAETDGILKESVDDVLTKVRRNGRPSIVGDYSVVSQVNGFNGFGQNAPKNFSDAALEEIRQAGFLGMYGGAPVQELPNQYDRTTLNSAGDNYTTLLPEGLMYVIPKNSGMISPLQVVQRGDLTSATGFHVENGEEVTRFDLEIGSGIAQPDAIGIISDTNFDAPQA
ncbi:hypothetical protein JOC34_000454 [Virgibacillus halotolerans]|uniref:hypothetical protein n=1 Tax=Virgibacillus halotolerans TaxID=1071053 RepID=UPI00195F7DFB|nr:hypothetical protein [Virgibacillus halotolerans]MBM7598097.1 hypothetical protein [Virgibacillus halotolerans]